MKQLNFRVDEELTERAEQYVDGVHFRSVGQILNIALAQWIALRELAQAPFVDFNNLQAAPAPVATQGQKPQEAPARPKRAKRYKRRAPAPGTQEQRTSGGANAAIREAFANALMVMLARSRAERGEVADGEAR
jgi:hypothetical protein